MAIAASRRLCMAASRCLNIFNVDELVRLFDGSGNPIDKSVSRQQFVAMLPVKADFRYSAFPVRSLPVRLTGARLRSAEWCFIFATIRKNHEQWEKCIDPHYRPLDRETIFVIRRTKNCLPHNRTESGILYA
jgi:hypothetical protein